MNKRLYSTLTVLYCFFIGIVAQNNAVTIKLLSSEPSEIFGEDYPSPFEYDSENRVSRVLQTNKYGEALETSVNYGDNAIIVNNARERYELIRKELTVRK